MEKTFCGKSCEDCAHKEAMACPGCLTGPGKNWGGDCDIAKCCREKGHENCTTCSFKSGCGWFSGAANAPVNRQRKQEQLQHRKNEIMARAAFLSKCIWPLFWLVIVGFALSLLELVIPLGKLSVWITLALNLSYSVILIYMAQVHEDFKTSGWIGVIGAVISAANSLFPDSAGLMVILIIPAAGFSIYGYYVEHTAFGAITGDLDQQLSEQWLTLRKWYLIGIGATFGGLFVALLIPVLGVLASLAGALVDLAVSIFKIIYLYRTAALFKAYC